MKTKTCHCGAYPFPHRQGGGRCEAPSYICSICRSPCEGVELDFGIGPYECHGYVGVHRDVHFVSECCEGDVLDPITNMEVHYAP